MTNTRCRWLIAAALLWYCSWAIFYIQTKPGFQYDEAIDVLGSVSLLHSHEELKLPHAPDTWFCLNEYCFPLMSARYIGSIKEYTCLALFAIFGPHAEVERAMAMTFGALGILGIAILLASQVGYAAAAAAAWVLAVNPSYLDMTALDNSGFSPWMLAVGLLCIALSAYLKSQNPPSAFWLGAAAGFGIWARANYIWMLAALSLALLICAGRRLLAPVSHWAAFVVGGIIGGLPFLAYNVLSGGGTWEAVGMFPVTGTLAQRLEHRLWMLSETVLSNGEHHRVWAGPESLPAWQLWLFPIVIAASCVVCIVLKQRRGFLPRVAALTLAFYAATYFFASLPIGEHHLMTLVPIAAIVVVLAGWQLLDRYRWTRIVLPLLAVAYAACGLYWQSAALSGLRRTGGVGPWSNGIYSLTERLRANFQGREIKVLDWGLQNSIYVLSNGQVQTRELFWDPTVGSWTEQIRRGGVFLLNGPQNRQIPAASIEFLHALDQARPTTRRYTIPQRSGIPFAEVIEIMPNTLGTGPAPPVVSHVESTALRAADPDFVKRSTGFYLLEQGGWRWTMRQFTLLFPGSLPAKSLTIHVNVPVAEIQKLGPITMTIRAGNRVLPSETFSQAGDFNVTRSIEPDGENRFDFSVDKTLPPTPGDTRELGIIFVSAKLEY